MTLFHIDAAYGLWHVLSGVFGALAFCLFPTKYLSELKEKLYLFRENQLVRQTVNRNRCILSNLPVASFRASFWKSARC